MSVCLQLPQWRVTAKVISRCPIPPRLPRGRKEGREGREVRRRGREGREAGGKGAKGGRLGGGNGGKVGRERMEGVGVEDYYFFTFEDNLLHLSNKKH